MGTSTVQVSDVKDGEDHPHACGDKYLSLSHFLILSGSSPRVWGQDYAVLLAQRILRIIPTRVGTRR